jgi:hypothetical protein
LGAEVVLIESTIVIKIVFLYFMEDYMLKKFSLAVVISAVAIGCSSIKSVDEIKAAQAKAMLNAEEAANDADAKFNRRFNKDYKGDKALKKIAIVFTQVSWDIGKDLRNGSGTSNVVGPASDYERAQKIVEGVYNQTKESFEKIGYTVISPSQLADSSPTFKALPTNNGVFEFSPTSGQEFAGVGVEGSRYIHMMTHEGKLISKISREAGIDAVVGLYINDLGYKGQETNLNKTFISGVTSEDISTGWLGDANHCGQASADFKNQYYLPWKNKKDEPEYQSVLEAGYDHLTTVYPVVVKGMIEELKKEGL